MAMLSADQLPVALVNSRDAHHAWALRVAEQVAEPLLTCEPVLAETAFHIGNVEARLNGERRDGEE